ncbi:MAG TPA: ABC-2 transporter permease [Candidatus Mediterraneibacter pullistercoris]|nr:ABC-2 transporter permease [Candidatus Mediterraneibacter pullistercoris]
MKGIMLKDLYDNFYIKKNLASYILGLGFIFLTIGLVRTQYTFILYIELLATILGSCALEAASDQDEKVNFDKLQITFPVTKSEIVIAKYLLALIFLAASNLLSLVFTLLHVYAWHTAAFVEGVQIWCTGICISVTFTAVIYVLFFLFGKKAATILYVIIAVLISLIYGTSAVIFGVENFIALDKTLILCIAIPASFLLFAASCLLSVRIYRKKHF